MIRCTTFSSLICFILTLYSLTIAASYAGIGRFVMGLLDEIEIVSPGEFREYVRGKVGK